MNYRYKTVYQTDLFLKYNYNAPRHLMKLPKKEHQFESTHQFSLPASAKLVHKKEVAHVRLSTLVLSMLWETYFRHCLLSRDPRQIQKWYWKNIFLFWPLQ